MILNQGEISVLDAIDEKLSNTMHGASAVGGKLPSCA